MPREAPDLPDATPSVLRPRSNDRRGHSGDVFERPALSAQVISTPCRIAGQKSRAREGRVDLARCAKTAAGLGKSIRAAPVLMRH
jgi:hypothetical protein